MRETQTEFSMTNLAEVKQQIASHLQDDFLKQDFEQQLCKIIEIYDQLKQSEHKQKLFQILEDDYDYKELDFVKKLVAYISCGQLPDLRRNAAKLLFDSMLWQEKPSIRDLILLRAPIEFKEYKFLTILEILNPFLDLGDKNVQIGLLKLLKFSQIEKLSNADKINLYSNLATLESSKTGNWSCKMAVFFYTKVKSICADYVILSTLDIKISGKLFFATNPMLVGVSIEEQVQSLYKNITNAAQLVLSKSGDYQYLSLTSLLKLFVCICKNKGYSEKQLASEYILSFFPDFSPEDKDYVRAMRNQVWDLKTIAGLIKEEGNRNIIDVILFYWQNDHKSWWKEISEFASIELVDNLLNLVDSDAELRKMMFQSQSQTMMYYIGSSYLLYRANLSLLKKNQGELEVSFDKVVTNLDYLRVRAGNDFKIEQAFLDYLINACGVKIKAGEIPDSLQLDVGFLYDLANKNNVESFSKVLSWHKDSKYLSKIIANLRTKSREAKENGEDYSCELFLDEVLASFALDNSAQPKVQQNDEPEKKEINVQDRQLSAPDYETDKAYIKMILDDRFFGRQFPINKVKLVRRLYFAEFADLKYRNILFKLLQEDYNFSKSVFLDLFVLNILIDGNKKIQQEDALILLDMVTNQVRQGDIENIKLRSSYKHNDITYSTVLEPIVSALDLQKEDVQEGLFYILDKALDQGSLPADEKGNIYLNLAILEKFKEGDFSLEMASFFIKKAIEYSQDKADAYEMEYSLYKGFFKSRGYDLSKSLSDDERDRLLREVTLMSRNILSGNVAYSIFSFSGLLRAVCKLADLDNESPKNAITELIISSYQVIQESDKNYIRENRVKFLDLALLSEEVCLDGFPSTRHVVVSNCIVDAWSNDPMEFWHESLKLRSANQQLRLYFLIYSAPDAREKLVNVVYQQIDQLILTNHLLQRAYLFYLKKHAEGHILPLEEQMQVTNKIDCANDRFFPVQKSFIAFLCETYGKNNKSIMVKKLPNIAQLDVDFIENLAKANNFNCFAAVVSTYCNGADASDKFEARVKKRFAKQLPHYLFFFERIVRNNSLFLEDQAKFFHILLSDLLVDYAQGQDELRKDNALGRLQILVQSASIDYQCDTDRQVFESSRAIINKIERDRPDLVSGKGRKTKTKKKSGKAKKQERISNSNNCLDDRKGKEAEDNLDNNAQQEEQKTGVLFDLAGKQAALSFNEVIAHLGEQRRSKEERNRLVAFAQSKEEEYLSAVKNIYQEGQLMKLEDSLSSEVRKRLNDHLYRQELSTCKQVYTDKLLAQQQELEELRALLQGKELEIRGLEENALSQRQDGLLLSENLEQERKEKDNLAKRLIDQQEKSTKRKQNIEDEKKQIAKQNEELVGKVQELTDKLNSLLLQYKTESTRKDEEMSSFREQIHNYKQDKVRVSEEKARLNQEFSALQEQLSSIILEHQQALEEQGKQVRLESMSKLKEQRERSLCAKNLQNNTIQNIFSLLFSRVDYDTLATFKAYYDIESGGEFSPSLPDINQNNPAYQQYLGAYNHHYVQMSEIKESGNKIVMHKVEPIFPF